MENVRVSLTFVNLHGVGCHECLSLQTSDNKVKAQLRDFSSNASPSPTGMAISFADLQLSMAPSSPAPHSENASFISSGSSINPYEPKQGGGSLSREGTPLSGLGSAMPSPFSPAFPPTPPFPTLAQCPSAPLLQHRTKSGTKSGKQKAEIDLTQVAENAARYHKLGKKARKELTIVSKVSVFGVRCSEAKYFFS
jgi:hypothetical protein